MDRLQMRAFDCVTHRRPQRASSPSAFTDSGIEAHVGATLVAALVQRCISLIQQHLNLR